jgi:DNA mismatch endonuclease, patch repair protein
MARNKGKGTRSTELSLRARLSAAGISGWKFHPQGIPGNPDFAFLEKKLAVFVDGCFWHGCAKCRTIPKTNTEFWEEKIMGNIARDKRVSNRLRRSGWHVLRFWEHDLKENPSRVIGRIRRKL